MQQVDPNKPTTDLDREAMKQLREELEQWRKLQFETLQPKPEEEASTTRG